MTTEEIGRLVASLIPLIVFIPILSLVVAGVVTLTMKSMPFRTVFLVCLWGIGRGALVMLAVYAISAVAGGGGRPPQIATLVALGLVIWLIRSDLKVAKTKFLAGN